MANHVQPTSGGYIRWHRAYQEGVYYSMIWPQEGMRYSRLGLQVREVEGDYPGRLGAGVGRGRYRQERFEWRRWLASAPYGRVDVLYYGGRMRSNEIRGLGGVQAGPPPTPTKPSKPPSTAKSAAS